jgi:serine phosphatase RsbU (regulator of sigma subunit)
MARTFKGIKLQMIQAVIAAVLSTVLVLSFITYILVSYTLQQSLKARATETAKILADALLGEQRQLAIRAETIVNDADFQNIYGFRADELPSVRQDLAGRMTDARASLAFIADMQHKKVTSAAASGDMNGDQLATAVALKKAVETNNTANAIEALGNRVYFVSATPIKRYEKQTLGYLVIANVFDRALINHLKEASSADVYLVHDGQALIATSSISNGQAQLKNLEERLSHAEGIVSIDGFSAAGVPLLASAMPMLAGDRVQSALVFALSAKDVSSLQQKVLLSSIALAMLVMILAGLLGLVIARRISDPIVAIEQSFREIADSGDLSQRITERYSDEVGQMAESFNKMQGQIELLHARVLRAEQRMSDELKNASAVQEKLFPSGVTDGARCQFASHSQTSTETGGDWYTVLNSPEFHTTTAIVSDVTGHGAAAALVTAILHGFFKATQGYLSQLDSKTWRPGVEALLQRLNVTMIESTRKSLATTLFLLTFDHRTLKARYVSAGHPPPLVVREMSGQLQVTTVPTPPSTVIGSSDEPDFAWGEFQLAPDHLFLLYTDGLIECTNAAEEMYGFKRLRRVLQRLSTQDARTIRDVVLKDAMDFFGNVPCADDITLIVGRVR